MTTQEVTASMSRSHLLRRFLDSTGLLTLARHVYPAYIHAVGVRTRRENDRFVRNWPADALPLPPPRLFYLVNGQYNVERFLKNGELGAKCIRDVLAKNGLRLENFQAILDFGCGCGRVMRHWSTLRNSRLYGTDYNASLVDWCRGALPFAQFSVNELEGRLSYDDAQFDFIYSISVFTHLTVAQQRAWMKELFRVLRPGGYVYVTVHGLMAHMLTPEEQASFEAGNPVVFGKGHAGSNICASFCPEPFMRNDLAKDFTVVDYVPLGAQDAGQDVYLLRKPVAERG